MTAELTTNLASQPDADAQATQAVASAPWSPDRAGAQVAASVQVSRAEQQNPVTPETTGQSLKSGPEGLEPDETAIGGAVTDTAAAGANIDDTQISQPVEVPGAELIYPTMAVTSISGGAEELLGSQPQGLASESEGALNGGTVHMDGSDDTDGGLSGDDGDDDMGVDAEVATDLVAAVKLEGSNIEQAAPSENGDPENEMEDEEEAEGDGENDDDGSGSGSDE